MKKVLCLISMLLILFSSDTIFAQCGNNFKSKYRAVNKIGRYNYGAFLLDDWTGDGRSDFWNFQSGANNTNSIIIYPGKSTGYWDWENPIILTTSLTNMSTANSSLKFFVKDFDSDSKMDFLIDNNGNYTIHQNNGSGMLVSLSHNGNPAEYQGSLGYYDMNNDGFLDWVNMVSVPGQGSSVGYQPGQANGLFGTRVNIITDPATTTKAIGDFDGNGKIDVAISKRVNAQNAFVYKLAKNMDGVNFEIGSEAVYGPSALTQFLLVKDFNNDGRNDIVAQTPANNDLNTTPRRLFILYGQSDGSFTTTELPVSGSTNFALAKMADFNGDQNPDIIETGSNFYSIYTNNVSGNFTRADYNRTLPTFNNIEDFSGDGKADIYDNTHNSYNNFEEEVVIIKENVCHPSGETKRINFDIDSSSDLTLWNSSNGNWKSANIGNGFTSVNMSRSFNWGNGSLSDIPALGDFDGDGKTDYTVFRNSTGEWYSLLSSSGGWIVFKFGLSGDIPIPGDFDGGGVTDFAVFRPSDGNWHIWLSESQQYVSVHFGATGDRPVPADYDGDDKTDIAVYRPTDGNWYYIKSSDLSVAVIHWGIETDKPLPADYDGDGKADLTVFRDGDWYVLRSSDGAYNYPHWGESGDIPIPLNREGDIAEIVVYRPSNNIWSNLRFIGQSQGIYFGVSQYTPVYFGLPNN